MKNIQKGSATGIVLTIGAVVILALVGVAGYFWYEAQQSSTSSPISISTTTPQVTNAKSTIPSAGSTAPTQPLQLSQTCLQDLKSYNDQSNGDQTIYKIPSPYGPLTTDPSASLFQSIPEIYFDIPWKDAQSGPQSVDIEYFISTTTTLDRQTAPYINFYNSNLDTIYSLSAYINSLSSPESTLQAYAASDKAVLTDAGIHSNQDFVSYILNLTPNSVTNAPNSAVAEADCDLLDSKLLLLKQSLFSNVGSVGQVLSFSNPYLSGYIVKPVDPANNIQVIAIDSNGDIYSILLHGQDYFSGTALDTFLNTLKIR